MSPSFRGAYRFSITAGLGFQDRAEEGFEVAIERDINAETLIQVWAESTWTCSMLGQTRVVTLVGGEGGHEIILSQSGPAAHATSGYEQCGHLSPIWLFDMDYLLGLLIGLFFINRIINCFFPLVFI